MKKKELNKLTKDQALKDIDKYKKAGTGLGAIAGYWASGRQRQK